MPEYKIPDGGCGLLSIDSDVDGDNDKTELLSLRSSSPKSASSCTDDIGSVVSDTSDRSAAAVLLELDEASGGQLCGGLEEDLEASLSLACEEDAAEELMRQGADMRHVLCTSWKLQPKMAVGMRLRKGVSGSGGVGGRAGQLALRDAAAAQKKAIIQVEYERYSSSRNNISGYRNRGGPARRPPPGFERRLNFEAGALMSEASPACSFNNGPTPILVSYADGSNTLSLAAEPMVLHDITVACVADTCHIFLSQMKNPTFAGLEPLEAAMAEAYNNSGEAAIVPLLRPIAIGSLLAVFSDEKWYRCQVVAYHAVADTCDIKFVDHGGYTTVSVAELRPLRSDFIRLPFQAIEVYVAAIRAADDEIMIDITSDLLFRKEVSLQLLGYAKDGVPVVQIYFYQEDFIHLLGQEILDDCYQTYLRAHPGHVAVAPLKAYTEEEEEEGSVCCSEENTVGADESGIGTGSEAEEEIETEWQEKEEEGHQDWSEQVERWNEADSTLAIAEQHTDITFADHMEVPYGTDSAYLPVYPAVFATEGVAHPTFYVPESSSCPLPVLYYVAANPASGVACFYPVVAAPVVAPLYAHQPAAYMQYVGEEESYSHREVEEEESCSQGEVEEEPCSHREVEEVAAEDEYDDDNVDASMAELLNKPYEEWSQDDYERFYEYEQQQLH